METKTRKTIRLLGSRWVFGGTVVLFALEAGWLAVTSRFPMAFDEAYHLGLIRFFSHRWNPIVTAQPPSSYRFGAIIQGPSWLYHYLMSFPYRLMELFTSSPAVQVVGLRLIDVALAVFNLFILRKLLRLIRVPAALGNVVLLVFALTPMVVVLSAQISYDDLLIPLTTLSVYETVLLVRGLDRKSFDSRRCLGLLCLCLLASLVKFAFLPILLAIALMVTWKLITYWRAGRARLLAQAAESFGRSGALTRAALLLATVLSLFLFVRLYGVNIIKYHNPVPQCNQVLNKQDCLDYYAWNSNYNTQQYIQAHPAAAAHLNVAEFTGNWMTTMSGQLYGAIRPLQGLAYISPALYLITFLFLSGAVVCTLVNFRKMVRDHPEMLTLLFIALVYVLFLWGWNYRDYRRLGQPVAISGRYLVPVIAYFYIVLGWGAAYALRRGRLAVRAKLVLAVIIIGVLVGLGGFVQYVTHIAPEYGQLSDTNSFVLKPTPGSP